MSPNGTVIDDASIGDDTELWRGVNPLWLQTEPVTGVQRPQSAAFKTADMSVLIASETNIPEILSLLPIGSRVARFTAGDARAAGCIVVRDGNPPNLPSHALVLHKDGRGKSITGSQSRKIRDRAQWVDGT